MSIQDYYAEMQKGMIRAGVHEQTEDRRCHFYSRLGNEIQNIIDYKEYNNVNCLFQLAMLVEKELQGHQLTKMMPSFTPRLASMVPSRTATASGPHSSMTPSAARAPSMSLTPFATAPHATNPSKASILYVAAATKPSSSTIFTSRTSDIKCHCCHGIGHFQRDCPNKKPSINTTDGGYVSTSDTEDDFAL
jgi:hypothetical protein